MSGKIKHRHQTSIPDGGQDVSHNAWNDSLVASEGTDGQIMARDSGQPDGWKWVDPVIVSAGSNGQVFVRDNSQPDGWKFDDPANQFSQRGTRASQPAANAVRAGTTYVVTDEAFIVEQSDGASWNPASPAPARIYKTLDSIANIANVAVTLDSRVFTGLVNKNTVGFHLYGDIFTNAGGGRTWSVIMTFGSTTLTLPAAGSSNNVSTTPIDIWGYVYIVNSGHNRSHMFGHITPNITAGTAGTPTMRQIWNFDDTNLYTGTQTLAVQLKCDSSGSGNFFSGGLAIWSGQ